MRTQQVWQVRLLRVGAVGTAVNCLSDPPGWSGLVAAPTVTMAARSAVSDAPPDDCTVPADAGFRGTENQHYRVEIRDGGAVGTATFVWSRDNGSVVTRWVAHDRSGEAYTRLCKHLRDGRQAYVVCPLVSESETIEARAAEAEAERLRRAELRDFRVGCLHGQLPAAERRAVMDAFKRRELDVLVATTVIEVGVDVPNATIMIVQEADRFGLAQLHQLRGRVGRGGEQSYCLLVSRAKEELSETARERLEAMVASTDGFELAERDLEIRGGGALLGARQSGLSDLRFARITHDRELLEAAREAARSLPPETMAPEVDALLGEAEHLGAS